MPSILRLFNWLRPASTAAPAAAGAGQVTFVGAGPGDPDLLTVAAVRAIGQADVVIHDRLVGDGVLALCPRRATRIAAGKQGFGAAVSQDEINRMVRAYARRGRRVVRLKSGDPTVFGRLDEEIAACDAAGVAWRIVPGITAASAGAAAIGQSQTKRGRNSSIRFLTGHDMRGFAEHDWRALARGGEVAAIYMGKRSARFIQGRLMMHGAAPDTPVTLIENASRPDQRIVAARLGDMADTMHRAAFAGPVLTYYGLAPRRAAPSASQTPAVQEEAS
jgi:uroporphyrin-III C-methyltransferase